MAGSTPQLTQAIEALLRTRLLMATLIFVGGFAGFLILGFFNPPQEVGPLVPFRIVQCSVTLILALLVLFAVIGVFSSSSGLPPMNQRRATSRPSSFCSTVQTWCANCSRFHASGQGSEPSGRAHS